MWLYDKENNRFVLSQPDGILKELHKSEMIEIGKKNIQKTMEFIDEKNLNHKYLHFSLGEIKEIKETDINESWDAVEKSVYHNPSGLWLSYGDSWLQYVHAHIKNPSMWNLYDHIYEIKVNDSVLIINSKKELYDFINKFKNDDNVIKIYNVINWNKVKESYNGLIILGDDIWNINMSDRMIILGNDSVQEFVDNLIGDSWKTNMLLLSEWVRHWETKTGVIWSKNGIGSINLIKKISFDIEFIKKDK